MIDQFQKILSGKRVIVTGASGFIGSHLCNELHEIGCEVHAISRTPDTDILHGDIKFEKIDLTNLNKARSYFHKVDPHYTFHIAGKADGSRSLALVPSTFQNNLITSVNMLTVAAEQKPGRLILMGSFEEPDSEEANFTASSPYAVSKWASTAYARMFNFLYKTPIIIIRLFMVYGPGKQDSEKLLPYTINKLLRNEPPELGSGQRKVDWIYIDDVIEGLIRAAIAEYIEGQTIDIGSGKLISIKKCIERVKILMNSDTEIKFGVLEDRTAEQEKKANTDDTFQKLGWRPAVDFDTGLRTTIEWYRNQLITGN